MKKLILLLVVLFIAVNTQAQKKEKIKGNKIVIEVSKDLEDFNAIEIGDNLKVTIANSVSNGYHLIADENLIDVIKFKVVNGELKIYTSSNITYSKKLEVSLTVKNINKITLKEDAKLTSVSRLNFIDFTFIALDNAAYDLDLEAENSTFNLYRSTSGSVRLEGEKAFMLFNENAFLKGEIALDELELTTNNRTDINLSGDVTTLKVNASGSSSLKAKNLETNYADLNSEDTADLYIYASKEIKIYAKDKSSVYVYGQPEIKVAGLIGSSQIVKK